MEADRLKTTQEVAKELNVIINHSLVIPHLKQIGEMWKNSRSFCLTSWPQIKNIVPLSLTLCSNNKPFLDWIVMWDKKWILYDSQQWWLGDWTRRSFHAIPKAKLAPEKVIVTVLWSAAGLIHYTFWIPAKLLHLRSMLSRSMKCIKKPQCLLPVLVNRKGPFLLHGNAQLHVTQPTLQKLNWATKFCLIHYVHLASYQLTTTSSSIWTTFCRENTSTSSRRQKMLSRSSSNPEGQIFMLQESTNFSHWQKYVGCNGSYFDNKDMIEPSYNDLKVMVWNHNYFCTDLTACLEKEMATHSSILAWKIPWTEKLGRLHSVGSQRVRHDWATSLWIACQFHIPFQDLLLLR